MDQSWIFASVIALTLAFSLSMLRRRVYKLEDMVLRLQDRVTDLSAGKPAAAPAEALAGKAAEAPAPAIDIEPFVD
jgi:hypothetical protein